MSETGPLHPLYPSYLRGTIEEIVQICKAHQVLLHVDAAQAVGKVPVNVAEVDIDFLTFTGHKFHAPPGVGVVYSKFLKKLKPIIFGGSQEYSLRPGTENLPGIVGIGKAAELRKNNFLMI